MIDQGHVTVDFAVSNFIDSKGSDILEFSVLEAVIDNPLHGAIDLVP